MELAVLVLMVLMVLGVMLRGSEAVVPWLLINTTSLGWSYCS